MTTIARLGATAVANVALAATITGCSSGSFESTAVASTDPVTSIEDPYGP